MRDPLLSTPDPRRAEKLAAFDRLLTIMDELRENCPWDQKQTFQSLRHLTIEETYELSDAILREDMDEVKVELGDLMLHMAFYARLGDERGAFDMETILRTVCEKLIRRHPHIYGDIKVENEQEVKANWEKIKLSEKKDASVLGGVPLSLPALVKAMRIQEKARGAGFDWERKEQVWEKVEEEMQEFHTESISSTDEDSPVSKKKMSDEFGDLLFSLINYARFMKIDPEEALERTNRKFISRFRYMEQKIQESGKKLHECSLSQMDMYWEEAKKISG